MSVDDKTGEISAIVSRIAEELGYLIYEFSVLFRGDNSYVAVRIDKEEGVSHHDCEVYSRALSARLDESAIIPRYTLEISSPGLNRKLRDLGEFKRFIGSPVKIVYFKDEKKDVVKGLLLDVQERSVIISGESGEVVVDVERVDKATLDY